MKSSILRTVLGTVTLALLTASNLFGQNSVAQGPASMLPDVPITRVIAMSKSSTPSDPKHFASLIPIEVRDTMKLYLSGSITDWYYRKDRRGVIFILDAESVEEAQEALSGLPLVKEGYLEFDYIPVGPLAPLGVLLTEPGQS